MTRPRAWRWARRVAATLGVGVLALAGWVLLEARGVGDAAEADVIIVLGAAAYGAKPSPVFAGRLEHGVALFRRGVAEHMLFTGGRIQADAPAEAEVGAAFARARGVPEDAILMETRSRTTLENLREALAVMRKRGLERAVLVSDPLHLGRARLLARSLGLEAATSPTPSTRFVSLRTQLPFLARECWFGALALVGVAG